MVEIIRRLGVRAEFADHRVEIDARPLHDFRADAQLASEIRGSFLLAAPLLARLGQAVLPQPGGDRIGRRRLILTCSPFASLEPASSSGTTATTSR
jgi:UDP-N-acetylglucosamine 1-carboxyvinyltransferase